LQKKKKLGSRCSRVGNYLHELLISMTCSG
jgi:hypothetical protein